MVAGPPGACLSGNGSLIGATANVMVSGISVRAGYPIGFTAFLKIGLPLMFLSIVIAHVYVWARYYLKPMKLKFHA